MTLLWERGNNAQTWTKIADKKAIKKNREPLVIKATKIKTAALKRDAPLATCKVVRKI